MKLNVLPARTGWIWVKLGLGAFMRQPLALAGLFIMFLVAMYLVAALPMAGPVLALALLPSATLGMMVATEEASRGIFPMPRHLLSAFRGGPQRLRSMLALGLMYAAGFLLILGISALFDGGLWAAIYLGTGPGLTEQAMADPQLRAAIWITMALHLPLSLLFWHAPALVYWHGVTPLKSLFFSFVACLRNFGALTVFGLAWLALFMMAGMAALIAAAIMGGAEVMRGLIFALAPLFAAIFTTSIYFTFRDTFGPPSEPGSKETG